MSTSLPVVFVALAALLLSCAMPVAHAGLKYQFANDRRVCFVEEVVSESHLVSGVVKLVTRKAREEPIELVLYDPLNTPFSRKRLSRDTENPFSLEVNRRVPMGAYVLCVELSSTYVLDPTSPVVIEVDVDQTAVKESLKTVSPIAPNRETVDGLEVFSFTDAHGQQKVALKSAAYLTSVHVNLEHLDSTLRELTERIRKELDTGDRMRSTSESTFTRLWVLGMVTIGVMTGVVWMQYRILTGIIRKKKLV